MLFRHGTLVDPAAGTERIADLRVREGKIAEVGAGLVADEDEEIIDCSGCYLSPGWMDLQAFLGEPGCEYRETLATGTAAAAAGGFTAVACLPDTDPPIHTRDVVAFLREQAAALPVEVHPIACLTRNQAGQQLTEMADLAEAGAVAFSDGNHPLTDAGLMRHALEYSTMLTPPVMHLPHEPSLGKKGLMHEGVVATRLGTPGIPAMAEEIMLARDLALAAFTRAHLHVPAVSTARSVAQLRAAKAAGVSVTASVYVHHLILTEAAVERLAFSTDTKVLPPLRPEADRQALIEGVREGTLDAICTGHLPWASFEKEVEYLAAPFGILGLETAWGLLCRDLVASEGLPLPLILEKLALAPRRILGLPLPALQANASANFTVFDTSTEWTFTRDHLRSRSRNTPFLGETLRGRVHGIYNRGQWVPAR